MLFDLQGKRKRFVQVIYLGLALLMGIGLVGLGIGGSAQGGIFDALGFGGNSTSSDPQYDEEIDRANETLASNPKDEGALLTLVRYEFLEARAAGESDPDTREFTPTAESIDHFENSVDAWERYLATKPDKPDDDRASLAYQAYSYTIDPTSPLGDEDLQQQTEAARIVADARPFFGNFLNLAFAAYIGGDEKTGAQAARDATDSAADETQEKQVNQVVKQAEAVRKQILAERKQRNKAGGGGALGGEPTEDGAIGPGGSDLVPPSTGELTPTP
jgi:hypothetical protein